ncbi:hypothetical protein [Naasia sp. SYSU D00057]|uniref:hypothetical protein n=1 Tax=Naasia sp. SYSU D00057 TaxID=2817380 RepID=UPI001B3041BF|nr:hypothetical protein [Naasia sp. SYSU D00057]
MYENALSCGSDDPIASNFVACRDDLTFTFTGTDIPLQAITIADIASFRPEPPELAAEPDGWAVVGMPANFVADARQQVVPGVLLGQPAEVRFTPVGYTWDYGDGTSSTTAHPGATWDALGVEEFTPTATSHAYTQRGRVTAVLTVTFAAEYRFVGPAWIPVQGTLDVATSPMPVAVVTAETMLVAGTCTGGSGPGC